MIDINYDTVRIRELGNNIIKLSQDYALLMSSLQSRLEKVPTNSKEWVGPAAEKFIAITNSELSSYSELSELIATYGSSLLTTANNIETAINQERR